MRCYRTLAMGAISLILGSCSSIIQGTDQSIIVNTNPPEATCSLERQGEDIGAVLSTPGSVTVSKTKHDITISCEKDGFDTATFINDSGWESGSGAAGIALDVLLTFGISSVIDSATGADNKYQSPVNITMVRASEAGSLSKDGAGDTKVFSDGEWFGQDGGWELSLTLEDGKATGQATRRDGNEYVVKGKIQEDNVMDGYVERKGNPTWAFLSGFFPNVLLVRNGQIEASFDLEKKAERAAGMR